MNISIMTPTKNRPDFIRRQLKYYSLSNFQGIILIGDSSNQKLFLENKKSIIKYGKALTIRHFHKPELTADKMSSFLSRKVKTDYSLYIADDDIILAESILAGINFLDLHTEYSAVHGKAFLMSVDDKSEPFGKLTYFSRYPMPTILDDTALGRIKEFFANVSNVNMSIIRSKINMDAYNEIEKLSNYYSHYIFGELVHGAIVCARGKIGQIDNCYLIRQSHVEMAYSSINMREWFSRDDWSNQYNILKLAINREILAYDNIEDINNKTSLILSSWHESLINNMLIKDKISTSVNSFTGVKKFLKRYSIVRVLHRFLHRLLFKKNILNILTEEDIDSQNNIRRYIDFVESPSEVIKNETNDIF